VTALRARIGQPLRRPGLAVIPIILIGVVGTVVALNDRSADSTLIYRQENLSSVQPAAVAHLVSLPRDPWPGLGRPRAVSASCSTRGIGELRNPWSCLVRYAGVGIVPYQVTISPNGRISAVNPTGQIVIHGCCVGPQPSQQ
jgi:hypothetical protein